MPLFISQRDVDLFNHLNREVIREIVETPVNFFKVDPQYSKTNVYGETIESKMYHQPVTIYGLVTFGAQETETTELGPTTQQTLIVALNREQAKILYDYYPEVGDVIEWNSAYYEISNVDESQFPGGKIAHNFSLICYAHMTTKPPLLIEDTRFGNDNE